MISINSLHEGAKAFSSVANTRWNCRLFQCGWWRLFSVMRFEEQLSTWRGGRLRSETKAPLAKPFLRAPWIRMWSHMSRWRRWSQWWPDIWIRLTNYLWSDLFRMRESGRWTNWLSRMNRCTIMLSKMAFRSIRFARSVLEFVAVDLGFFSSSRLLSIRRNQTVGVKRSMSKQFTLRLDLTKSWDKYTYRPPSSCNDLIRLWRWGKLPKNPHLTLKPLQILIPPSLSLWSN